MSIYSAELLAYLAGCMDSDGSFMIRRDQRAMRQKSRTPTHVAMIALRQVTPQVPELLHETFGGHLGITRPTAMNGRVLIGWHTTATKAAVACHLLLPYLRIKASQAELLIALQERKGCLGFGVRTPPDELAARDEIYDQVRALNRTGAAA